jgi:hypothetical protein
VARSARYGPPDLIQIPGKQFGQQGVNIMRRKYFGLVAGAAVFLTAILFVLTSGSTPAEASSRWGANYFPNVTLTTQDGKQVHFYDDLLKGKTVVITGGTSGIGEVAAEALAQMGARIILVARSRSRADATLTRLRESGPNVTHSVYFADLARLAEMKRVAAEIAIREPPIDVLINNAGALFGTRRLTDDGVEYTFALNHMSYFVLTHGLRERLHSVMIDPPATYCQTASWVAPSAQLDAAILPLRVTAW